MKIKMIKITMASCLLLSFLHQTNKKIKTNKNILKIGNIVRVEKIEI